MRQRGLLVGGIAAITASLLLGLAGVANGVSGWSMGGMMGSLFHGGNQNIGIDRAVTIAKGVAGSYAGGGLAVDEVIEFTDNYYASIRETSTHIGALEILIDKSSGSTMPEPTNMMWNTKYGATRGGMMGGGMMGNFAVTGSGPMSVTSDQAREIAQRWLDANRPGTTANTPDPFYGYYTVDFAKAGTLAGMLSVNDYTGQVWYHNWHGDYVQTKDLGA